jgi:hypothetical protein
LHECSAALLQANAHLTSKLISAKRPPLKHVLAGHSGPVLIQYSLENCRPCDTRGTDILEAQRCSGFEMKSSALEPLTDMGHTIEETYGRLCSEAFYDSVLEKVCDLPIPNGTDDSAPMEISFVVDERALYKESLNAD